MKRNHSFFLSDYPFISYYFMKIWRKIKSSSNFYRKKKFDQIWPSLKLTYRQRKKFQSKEKFFTRELKKSIPLRIKWVALQSLFRLHSFMNIVPGTHNLIRLKKLPSRFMIYHKNLISNQEQKVFLSNDMISLKSIFLAPGVLRVRKLEWSYALKMKAMNRIRLLLGNIPLKKLVTIFRFSHQQSNIHKVWKFVGSLESFLPVALLKMGMNFHIHQSIQAIKTSKILKNGEYKNGVLAPGSIVEYCPINTKNTLTSAFLMPVPTKNLLFQPEFNRTFGEEFTHFYRVMWNMISHRDSFFKAYVFQKTKKRFRPILKRKISRVTLYNPPFGFYHKVNLSQFKVFSRSTK